MSKRQRVSGFPSDFGLHSIAKVETAPPPTLTLNGFSGLIVIEQVLKCPIWNLKLSVVSELLPLS